MLSVFDGNRTEHLLLTGEGLAASGGSLIGLLVGFLICCLLRPLPWQYAGRRSRRTLAGATSSQSGSRVTTGGMSGCWCGL